MHDLFYDTSGVQRERDPATWGERFNAEDVAAWRESGFSAAEAQRWSRTLDRYGLYTEWEVKVASAWVVAGFEPESAEPWFSIVDDEEPEHGPRMAREWRDAQFSSEQATIWAEREDIPGAAGYINCGWEVWQRDLLTVLLDDASARLIAGDGAAVASDGTVDIPALCDTILCQSLPVGNALDYVRAGIPVTDWGAYERMRAGGVAIDGVLARYGENVRRPFGRLYRAEWIRRVEKGVKPSYHQRTYWDDEPDLYAMEYEPEGPMAYDWAFPTLLETWEENGWMSGVWRRDHGEWDLNGCAEDYALAPRLNWDEDQERAVHSALAADLDAGETCTVEWPPEGYLTTEGWTFEPLPEPCERHDDEFAPHCFACQEPGDPLEDAQLAEFAWTVLVTTYTRDEEGNERELGSDSVCILTTRMDPRAVEFSTTRTR